MITTHASYRFSTPCLPPLFFHQETQGSNLKTARKTSLTQSKEHSCLTSIPLPHPEGDADLIPLPQAPLHFPPPQIIIPTKTILARHFPKPLGKKLSSPLRQTKCIMQSSEAEETFPWDSAGLCGPFPGGNRQGTEMVAASQ